MGMARLPGTMGMVARQEPDRRSGNHLIYATLFYLGLIGSWFATRLVQIINSEHPSAWKAFAYDLGAIECGVASLQVWGDRGMDFWLLQAETLGLALGTFIAVRWGKK